MAGTSLGEVAVEEFSRALREEMMVEMLNSMQGTAAMLADIAAQHMAELRLMFVRELMEQMQLPGFAQAFARAAQPPAVVKVDAAIQADCVAEPEKAEEVPLALTLSPPADAVGACGDPSALGGETPSTQPHKDPEISLPADTTDALDGVAASPDPARTESTMASIGETPATQSSRDSTLASSEDTPPTSPPPSDAAEACGEEASREVPVANDDLAMEGAPTSSSRPSAPAAPADALPDVPAQDVQEAPSAAVARAVEPEADLAAASPDAPPSAGLRPPEGAGAVREGAPRALPSGTTEEEASLPERAPATLNGGADPPSAPPSGKADASGGETTAGTGGGGSSASEEPRPRNSGASTRRRGFSSMLARCEGSSSSAAAANPPRARAVELPTRSAPEAERLGSREDDAAVTSASTEPSSRAFELQQQPGADGDDSAPQAPAPAAPAAAAGDNGTAMFEIMSDSEVGGDSDNPDDDFISTGLERYRIVEKERAARTKLLARLEAEEKALRKREMGLVDSDGEEVSEDECGASQAPDDRPPQRKPAPQVERPKPKPAATSGTALLCRGCSKRSTKGKFWQDQFNAKKWYCDDCWRDWD